MLNAGIGGNRLVLDSLGPNAMARFDRDVLNQAGVRYVIVLEGVNDLGTLTRDQPVSPEAHVALVARMITSYDQMIQRARERGIKVYGATVMPYAGSAYYHPDAVNEQDRQAVNAWIRDARALRRGDRLRQADGRSGQSQQAGAGLQFRRRPASLVGGLQGHGRRGAAGSVRALKHPSPGRRALDRDKIRETRMDGHKPAMS